MLQHSSHPSSLSEVCIFRGAEMRTVVCPACKGRVEIRVFACELYGECTLRKFIAGATCCSTCSDKRSSF